MDFINILEDINKQLSIIADSVSSKDYLRDIIPWGLGVITSAIGAIITFFIMSKLEKKKFIRDSHIEYMKLTNNFTAEINKIITSMVHIQEMGFILIGDPTNPDSYEPYFYGNLNDYLSVAEKIRALRKVIDGLPVETTEIYTSRKQYIEKIKILSDDILKFDKIVSICSEYEKEVMNYYYFINKKLRKDHAEIINSISKATKENMNKFDIERLKKSLIEQIQKTNELILGYEIKEPNYFNKIQEKQEIEKSKSADVS